jgi:hypothetical protein
MLWRRCRNCWPRGRRVVLIQPLLMDGVGLSRMGSEMVVVLVVYFSRILCRFLEWESEGIVWGLLGWSMGERRVLWWWICFERLFRYQLVVEYLRVFSFCVVLFLFYSWFSILKWWGSFSFWMVLRLDFLSIWLKIWTATLGLRIWN